MSQAEKPAEVRTTSQSSVEITRGAKGGYAFSVKVYDDDSGVAFQKATTLADGLAARFVPEGASK